MPSFIQPRWLQNFELDYSIELKRIAAGWKMKPLEFEKIKFWIDQWGLGYMS